MKKSLSILCVFALLFTWMAVPIQAADTPTLMASATVTPIMGMTTKPYFDNGCDAENTTFSNGTLTMNKTKKGSYDVLVWGSNGMDNNTFTDTYTLSFDANVWDGYMDNSWDGYSVALRNHAVETFEIIRMYPIDGTTTGITFGAGNNAVGTVSAGEHHYDIVFNANKATVYCDGEKVAENDSLGYTGKFHAFQIMNSHNDATQAKLEMSNFTLYAGAQPWSPGESPKPILTACPTMAPTTKPTTDPSGVLTYTVSNGEVIITQCNRYATDVTIPATLGGYPVTSIGNSAFRDCAHLTSITIPNSVTSIGDQAFLNCENLASIHVDANNMTYSSIDGVLFDKNKTHLITFPEGRTETSFAIPNGVISIGDEAFCSCNNLASVTISDSVTSVGDLAFAFCRNLASVTIPNGVTSIGDYAFYNCESLTSIEIPNSVTSIGSRVFEACTSLRSITMPDSVTSIGYGVFKSSGITSIKIPKGMTCFRSWEFDCCRNLTSIIIPDTVTSIEVEAFEFCTSLTSIEIPDSVTSIDYAFGNCPNLENIHVDANNMTYSSIDGVLFDKNKTHLITCPEGRTGAYVIPNSVTKIDDLAFLQCHKLTSVEIPNSVTSIGPAFCYCKNLTSITVDENNRYYSSVAGNLYNKDQSTLLQCAIGKIETAFTIPNGVISIGYHAFEDCTSLTSIEIPNSVANIESSAFEDCTSLTDVYYSGTAAEWNKISIGYGNDRLVKATKHYILPTPTPCPPVIDMGSAKPAANGSNAYYYVITLTNTYGTTVQKLTTLYYPKDRTEADAERQNFSVTGINGSCTVKFISVLSDIPEAQKDRLIKAVTRAEYEINGEEGEVSKQNTTSLSQVRGY